MKNYLNYGVIILVNFIFIGFIYTQRPSSISSLFSLLFYSLFYILLCLSYFFYFRKNRKSLFIAVWLGLILGGFLGAISFLITELITVGNIQFIIDDYYKFGLKFLIKSLFIRSFMISFHFIIGLLSAVTCFLIIEQISKKNARMSAHNMT